MKHILSALLFFLLINTVNAQELLDSEQPEAVEHALYGFSTSIYGEWALIGAPQKDFGDVQSVGSVIFYSKKNSRWEIELEVSPIGLTDFSNFGVSLDLEYSDALIGATGDHEGGIFSGAVYAYEYTDTTWSQIQKLKPSDPKPGSKFGQSVDLYGASAVIGAYQANGNESKSGAAYVFEKVNGEWSQTAKLIAEDGVSHNYFGYSVTMVTESIIAVGAYNADGANERSGVVYIFEKNEEGGWEQTVRLFDQNGSSSDLFGFSITSSQIYITKSNLLNNFNGVLYIGAPGTMNENGKTGSIYLYQKSESEGWELNTELIEESSEHNDHFGISVAANDYGRFYVGASRSSQNGDSKTGTVFQYEIGSFFNETPDSEVHIISIIESGEFDNFGYQVAADELTLLVSSPHADEESITNSGKIFFFDYRALSNEETPDESVADYRLEQNYPNPFNPSTEINYQVKESGLVKLTVFNLLGQEVQTLVNEQKNNGAYSINFDASALSSGFYFYRLEVNDFVSVKKMMLIK